MRLTRPIRLVSSPPTFSRSLPPSSVFRFGFCLLFWVCFMQTQTPGDPPSCLLIINNCYTSSLWPTISVRLPPHHLPPPILTGKSEKHLVAKAAIEAGHPAETETDVRTDLGVKTLVSSGKRSAATMTRVDETAMRACSEATETITDHGPGPDHHLREGHLREDHLREETRGIAIRLKIAGTDHVRTRIEKRRRRRNLRLLCLHNP